MGTPPTPALCYKWADKGGYFPKLSYGSETSDMTCEGSREMIEGDSADMCGGKFPLMTMWGADPGARTPIGISGN